jgi:hypothetical protein
MCSGILVVKFSASNNWAKNPQQILSIRFWDISVGFKNWQMTQNTSEVLVIWPTFELGTSQVEITCIRTYVSCWVHLRLLCTLIRNAFRLHRGSIILTAQNFVIIRMDVMEIMVTSNNMYYNVFSIHMSYFQGSQNTGHTTNNFDIHHSLLLGPKTIS